jgi:acyl-CoA synthetase (AMP-forming)/AMP-acid ligase II
MADTIFEALRESAALAPDNALLHVPTGASYMPDGLEWTYAETLWRAEALKLKYLQAGCGRGHRVALLLENRPDYFIHLFALNALGASVVPVNPDYRHSELTYLLDHCQPALVVALDNHIERLRAVSGELERPVAIIDTGAAHRELPPAPSRAAPGPLDRATEAAVFYTSGTTGRPKGCLVTNDYWLATGEWFLHVSQQGGLFRLEPGRDRLFNPLPVFHVHAGVAAFMPMLLSQGCLIRPEHFSAKSWWREVTESRATIAHYIGVVPQALLARPEGAEDRAHGLRFGFGACMEPAIHARFEARFGIPHVEVWGMTEVGRSTANDREPRPVGVRAIGRATAPLEARIVDDNGHELPANTEGELVVRVSGPDPRAGFFAGYLNDEEATEAGWRGGWWHSGDVVRQDESGMLFFVDRKKNMIRRSGENIAAAEIETVLSRHPAVERIAVLSVPDEKCGEEILACVIPSGGQTADEELARDIFEYCHRNLAYFKAPGWILFLEEMPMTATQKISKGQIFAAGVDPRRHAGIVDLRAMKKRQA